MSMDPQSIATMLASQLGGQQPQSVGGIQGQVSPMSGAAQLAQKIMLMQALRKPPQQTAPQPGMPQNPTTIGAPELPGQALPQQMNQAPMSGAVNA